MQIAASLSLLDNCIWHSLSTLHSSFAEGDDFAKRYPPVVTPLAATRDQSAESYNSLFRLLPPGGAAGLVLASQPALPAGWTIVQQRRLIQMVWNNMVEMDEQPWEELSNANADEMVALTELTKPGPFGKRTVEMGRYIGIHRDGQLAAMAGERLRLPGYTEISAVCTHPDHRGRGYATSLMAVLIRGISGRNEIPFLHVAEENLGAISVYEALGFRARCVVNLAVVKRDAP